MMKRRFQSNTRNGKARYVQYKNKVQIDDNREQLGDLLFHLQWYKATKHHAKHRVGRQRKLGTVHLQREGHQRRGVEESHLPMRNDLQRRRRLLYHLGRDCSGITRHTNTLSVVTH